MAPKIIFFAESVDSFDPTKGLSKQINAWMEQEDPFIISHSTVEIGEGVFTKVLTSIIYQDTE